VIIFLFLSVLFNILICLELVMPQISGLEALKEGTFSVDLETTISDMLLVIKKHGSTT
jgi:hypothetical protein